MRREDQLASITCWLGHVQDQEQWTYHAWADEDGNLGERCESRCHCGENMNVYFNADGRIVEEVQG